VFCGGPQVKKVQEPHPDIGCWWTLYDYGLEKVKTWPKDYVHPYPGASPHPTRLADVNFRGLLCGCARTQLACCCVVATSWDWPAT
jgi:hypothetical protein